MVPLVPNQRGDEIQRPRVNTRDQLRFPLALKKARLARQLKQETLAAQLHVKLRTLVSWETGTRIPSVGMVALLSVLLTGDLRLDNDLVRAYVADDLVRQASIQGDGDVHAHALSVLEQLSENQARNHTHEQEEAPLLSLLTDQGRGQQEQRSAEARDDPLQQLFTILETLRDHPDLIPVARDFLREVVHESSGPHG